MKKQLLTLGLTALAAGNYTQAQVWSEDFNSGFPAGWKLYNVDNLTPTGKYSYITDAWVTQEKKDSTGNPVPGDSVIVSTSYYSPAGTANDWIVTPAFTVSSANMAIKWDEKANDASFPDGYEVRISTTGDAVADFTDLIYSTGGAAAANYTTRYASLASYNGQSIHVAFRNNSNDKDLLMIDNISAFLAPSNDLALTKVTPSASSPKHYGVNSSNMTLGGTVFNFGATMVTSFTVKYQQGANPVVSNTVSGVSIPAFSPANFTLSTPYAIPATLGDYPMTMWIELAGDANSLNDSGATSVTSVAFMPTKRIFIEEATGTWCGWCPRGAVYMDSLWNTHQANVSLAAIHNGDPMVLSSYDSYIGTKISGYPSVVIDRHETLDPSELVDAYENYKENFGFADISLSYLSTPEFGFSVKASVKPALDLSGDYRLALVLTEDDVHGTNTKTKKWWSQSNYYSGNIPLTGAGHDWYSEPDHVADTNMEYDFVARHLVPGPDGAAGSLPSVMTANTIYDYTFNTTIRADYHRDKMRAIVILLRNSDGEVLNSSLMTIPLGISNIPAGVDYFNIFPNPATNNATVKFTLNGNSHLSVMIIDAVGRVVKNIPSENYTAGTHTVDITTAELSTGLYNVRIQTEKGMLVKQLSVIK